LDTDPYLNARVYAFNKKQMYAGAASPQFVSFDAPTGPPVNEFTVLPANARLQTGAPPAGAPNYFAVVWGFLNAVRVYKFHVDWTNTANSTFTWPFTSTLSNWWAQLSVAGTDSPFHVPSPVNPLDALYERLMVQNQYTNISGVE